MSLLKYINKKKKLDITVGYSRHKKKIKMFFYVCSKICLVFRIRICSFLVHIIGEISKLKLYFSNLLIIH